MPSRLTTYQDFTFTPVMAEAIQAAEHKAGCTFTITQGGFNGTNVAASAGTHAGDAVDLSIRGLGRDEVAKIIESLRWAGIAAWLRTTDEPLWGTPAHGFGSPHIHGVPNGWGAPSPGAASQAEDYRNGLDGLRGRRPDTGPGHTRAYYTKTHPETMRKDWLEMATEQDLRRIVKEEITKALYAPVGDKKHGGLWGSSLCNQVGHSAAYGQTSNQKLDEILRLLKTK